ncbi:hypothetical protein KSP40_PGU000583 [Platanthera guangdongensis]|uniref:Uncharacterized protein n=1 Tax=Platanthera guangdongensis TaxID=2320717 RepID=A0ABR2MEK3_9ASPA
MSDPTAPLPPKYYLKPDAYFDRYHEKSNENGKYQHASIQLFIMNQKDSPKHGGKLQNTSSPLIDNGSDEECNKGETEIDVAVEELTAPVNTKTDDWEARRHGAIAAQLLRNVKLA